MHAHEGYNMTLNNVICLMVFGDKMMYICMSVDPNMRKNRTTMVDYFYICAIVWVCLLQTVYTYGNVRMNSHVGNTMAIV